MKTKWMIIPVVAFTLGCTREIDKNVTYIDGEFTFYATSGENETRTVLQQDGRVFWSPSDCINVFYGDMSGKFTSTNTEASSSAEFTGSLGSFVLDGETEFKAIYPYSEGNTVTGDTFNLTLPSEQVAVEGTFADDLFINVAKSKDYNLHFYNVCGGVKFSLARDDIKKVVFRGNNGEILAGRLSVEFVTEQIPSVSNVDNGKTSVTLVAPDGGTFRKGAFYYIVLVPQVLQQGYTMELYSDALVGTVKSDSPVTIRRSAWGVLKNLVPEAPSVLDGAIVMERKYLVYSTDMTSYCYPSITLVLNNEQHLRIGYYDTNYWTSSSTGRHGVIITCGVYEDQTRNEEWYVQPRVSGEWVEEKVIVKPEGKVQYYSNGEYLGEHEFSAPILEGASSLYVIMTPYGWWYTHYHFMDDFKLTMPYQTITDNFNNGVLDLTIWEEPVNPDGVFVEDGILKTIQKRTDQDFCLRSRPISLGPTVSVESVSLDRTNIQLSIGGQMTLTASILPENATNKTIIWSSSDESVAKVSSAGLVTGLAAGSAVITVTTADGGKTATCSVTVEAGSSSIAIPEAIDLGLPSGLKWASFNLGATAPEEYGDYFAWGETEPYYSSLDPLTWKEGKDAGYSWGSYTWCMGAHRMTKYCSNAEYGYNGFMDNKTTLDPEDDAAHVNLGGNWRMPTNAEFAELCENCTWVWTSMNGKKGQKVTGPNGNSIFLPAPGERDYTGYSDVGSIGYYWSSSLDAGYPDFAWYVYCRSGTVDRNSFYRFCGFSIRPVFGNPVIPVISVSLDKAELGLAVGESVSLDATVLPENATNKTVSWTSSNESVATVSSTGLVKGIASGFTVITVTTVDGGKTATCNVTVSAPYTVATPEAIDLGLPSGLKWASFNLGASKPEEYGDYFAWGETEPDYYSQDPLIWKPGKEAGYTWETYKWCMGSMNTITKYCLNADKGYNGFTDEKTVLDPEDDAVHVNLGGNWRMPTLLEQKELVDNCTGEWVSQNGVVGMLVTGPNGNNIFLPAAGYRYGNFTSPISTSSYGCYWSSALFKFEPYETYEAEELWIYSDGLLHWDTIIERPYGCSIRPVYDDK